MTDKKFDPQIIAALILEINSRMQLLHQFFTAKEEFLLKDLASASIHLSMFIRSVVEYHYGEEISKDKKLEEKFLRECGCKVKVND